MFVLYSMYILGSSNGRLLAKLKQKAGFAGDTFKQDRSDMIRLIIANDPLLL